jgi:uncharacterized protein (UPF0210 family)
MEIRAVTCFVELDYPLSGAQWKGISEFATAARRAFAQAGYRVQTIRLASQPFGEILAANEALGLTSLAREVEAAARDAGVDYVSLGPASAVPGEGLAWELSDEIPDAIAATDTVFFAMTIASKQDGTDMAGLTSAGDIIRRVSRSVANGFGNLRLAALANCTPWAAFFPAAYHGGGGPRFAIATEAADLAVQAVSVATSPADAEDRLTALVQQHADGMTAAARALAQGLEFAFAGIDFSLAPYPTHDKSIAHALELFTGDTFGGRGTVVAASAMTRAVRRATFQKTGFCGLLLPVLEDSTLAARSQERGFDLDTLLLCSTVCGSGLDTVPLPGDIGTDELAAILADLATLAVRLDKPLTARLMPIPGKQAGDLTEFDFEYFANAGVLGSRGSAPALWR